MQCHQYYTTLPCNYHMQLCHATIKCNFAMQLSYASITHHFAMQGLAQTLFERLQGMYGPHASAMLTVQYRMNKAIMDWPSKELYRGVLTAHASVASHTLQDLPVRQCEACPVLFGSTSSLCVSHGVAAALL